METVLPDFQQDLRRSFLLWWGISMAVWERIPVTPHPCLGAAPNSTFPSPLPPGTLRATEP
jgi:hypothetical protein